MLIFHELRASPRCVLYNTVFSAGLRVCHTWFCPVALQTGGTVECFGLHLSPVTVSTRANPISGASIIGGCCENQLTGRPDDSLVAEGCYQDYTNKSETCGQAPADYRQR
jgi:hypothetical protein